MHGFWDVKQNLGIGWYFPNKNSNSISQLAHHDCLGPKMPLKGKSGEFQKLGFEILQDSGGPYSSTCSDETAVLYKVYSFVDGKPVGQAEFRVWNNLNYISLTSLKVLEEDRLKGYAKEMIRHIADYARTHNKGVWINANTGNDEFYAKSVKSLFDFPEFVFPKDDGCGYHAFMIPNEKVQTLKLIESPQVNLVEKN